MLGLFKIYFLIYCLQENNTMKKIFLNLFLPLITFSLALLMAGCGRKGSPEAPSGSTYNYPQCYPAES